jgi:hypothetical protein
MAQMRVSSFHAAEAELVALDDLAARVGVAKSRLIRVGIGRLDGVPLEDLRQEAEALPDGRRKPEKDREMHTGTTEREIAVQT